MTQIAVLSGSCSPMTERQISYAADRGYTIVQIHPTDDSNDSAAAKLALDALSAGVPGVVISSARSQSDRVEGLGPAERKSLGQRSGRILARILDETGLRRVVVAGGDTSSHAGGELGIDALTFLSHLAPGAPLCKAWSSSGLRDGLEIVFKGGQCGREEFFESVRNGSVKGRI